MKTLSTAASNNGLDQVVTETGGRVGAEAVRTAYLAERLLWLIRLRWIAIGGIVAVIVAATSRDVLDHPYASILVAGFMVLYNTLGWRWARHNQAGASNRALQRAVFVQLLLDLTALAVLLYFSGGTTNPFVMFFAFHMAIGAMLLPLSKALQLGVAASLLHGGFAIGELLEWIPRHPLRLGLPSAALPSAHFVPAYLTAFVLMLFGVIYFVHSIAARHRREEELRWERETVALSRARMARIGEISAGVAHTIRNPLHGVMNGIEIISRRTSDNERLQGICNLVSDGLRRIERVTERLLSLTRDVPLEKTRTDFEGLLRETLKFAEVRVHKKGLRLTTDVQPVPPLFVDPNRLSEALLNVLDNAVDACGSGDTISVRGFSRSGGVAIEITDTGEGIAPETMRRVFRPFFTTKPVGEGTGLGLAIARRVAQEHGGRIEITSQPGQGTQVTFLLPGPTAGG